MNNRIIIALMQSDDQLMCFLDDAGNIVSTQFSSQPPAVEVDAVSEGKSIYQSLMNNPNIKQALSNLNPHKPDPCAIYFYLRSDAADPIGWETLSDGAQFFALDPRWPIVRMAARAKTAQRFITSPLRILAVMGAVNCSAAKQWKHLCTALLQSPLSNAWELHGLVCEPDLLKQPNPPDPRIHAELLTDRKQLLDKIEQFSPHIVHFFCHGTPGNITKHELPTLVFANRNDFDGEIEPGSIQLTAAALAGSQALMQKAWLLTLNSCSGAKSSPGITSLARTLVELQVPAVVGMRFLVSPADADRFCESFYCDVFKEVATAQRHPGTEVELDWAHTLSAARQAINANGGNSGNWANPILYVGPDPLRLRAAIVTGRDINTIHAKQEELNKLKEFRTTVGPSLPAAVFAQLEQRIQQIGKDLYE